MLLVRMGRPREFDEQEVLDRALGAFWTHGYEATSMADLTQAMGLAKGSIYKGFGDKRSLLLRALDAYLEAGRAGYGAVDDPDLPAAQVLRTWLRKVAALATDGFPRKGCFGVNCATELGPHDAEVRDLIEAHNRWLHQQLARTIQRGVRAGELRGDLRPTEAARWVTTVMAGMQVRGKLGISRREANRMAELAVEALADNSNNKEHG